MSFDFTARYRRNTNMKEHTFLQIIWTVIPENSLDFLSRAHPSCECEAQRKDKDSVWGKRLLVKSQPEKEDRWRKTERSDR